MMKGHATFPALRSRIEGITWPPLVGANTAPLLALLYQLEETQWLAPEEISAHQHRQLVKLARHAQKFSPHFHGKLQAAGLQPDDLATPQGLRKLPILSRRDLQSAGQGLFCKQLPKAHMPMSETRSSGSTGEPVVVQRTAINQLFWLATVLREHLWQQRDFRGTLAVIRARLPEQNPPRSDWGSPVNLLFASGPSHGLTITTDIVQQAEWLTKLNPDYLLTYPTNLAALLQQLAQGGMKLPRLRQVRTIGETLSDELRAATRSLLNVDIADAYSSQELGTIALQCPQSGLYHVMSESLIVEVLDEQGESCLPGQIGQLVITDLHNLATPLIRYSIGDYAEVGPACPCGRGLTALKRIVGRERNMLLLPDGRRHWPLMGAYYYRDMAPIRQFQIIQRDREMMEVRLVSDSPLTITQEAGLRELTREWLGFPFQLKFTYFPTEIPRSSSGKFEEFICEASP